MTQQVLRTSLLLNGLLAVMILALRLLPNDDNSIKKLLLPPTDCPAPCFMNVQAGTTDRQEAAKLIDIHSWVKPPLFFARSIDDINTRYVFWQWSGEQPVGVDARRQGQLRFYKDHAVGLVVHTTIPLGAVWLALGGTDKGTLSLSEVQSNISMLLVLVYPEQGLLVRAIVPKRLSQAALWTSVTEIESSNPQAIAYFGAYRLPIRVDLKGVK